MRRGHKDRLAASGFSLIEMIVYVALLAVIFILVVQTVLSFTKSYSEIAALRAANHAGIDGLERMTRDIRKASSITTGSSTLGTSPGTLVIVETSGANSTTTKFYIENSTLQLAVNGSYVGPLTGSSTSVTSLIFYKLSTTTSQAVKIDVTVQGRSGPTTKTKIFHSTTVLKGAL